MTLRQSVRALILDPDDNVLLVRFEGAPLEPVGGFWAIPGGGIEPGESALDAMRREMHEEVGIEVDALGPEVWTKTAYFSMGTWTGQVDHIHLLRVDHFDPKPALTPEQLAAELVREVRWWSVGEIMRSDATFAPRALRIHLRRLLDEGIPPEPIQITGF